MPQMGGLMPESNIRSLSEHREAVERERKRSSSARLRIIRSTQHPEEVKPSLRILTAFNCPPAHRITQASKQCESCGAQVPLANYPKSMRNPDETHRARVCWDCVNADPEGRVKLMRERARDTNAWTRKYRRKAYLAAQARYNAKRER